eukprot:Sspe_Gene.73057::Locus_43851_Transcript_1_1_Confidence_1.000_Length_1232::g.73057::m.73057
MHRAPTMPLRHHKPESPPQPPRRRIVARSCKKCGEVAGVAWIYCGSCGEELQRDSDGEAEVADEGACGTCGAPLRTAASKYCAECGVRAHPLSDGHPGILTSTDHPELLRAIRQAFGQDFEIHHLRRDTERIHAPVPPAKPRSQPGGRKGMKFSLNAGSAWDEPGLFSAPEGESKVTFLNRREVKAMAARMHNLEVETRKRRREALRAKYQDGTGPPKKVLRNTEAEKMVSRLHTVDWARRRTERQQQKEQERLELQKRTLRLPHKPAGTLPVRNRTQVEIEATSTRLSQGLAASVVTPLPFMGLNATDHLAGGFNFEEFDRMMALCSYEDEAAEAAEAAKAVLQYRYKGTPSKTCNPLSEKLAALGINFSHGGGRTVRRVPRSNSPRMRTSPTY